MGIISLPCAAQSQGWARRDGDKGMRAGCCPWLGAGVGQGGVPGVWESPARSPLPHGACSIPAALAQPGLSRTCRGASPGPGLPGEELQLGWGVGRVQWCQACSQNWMGQGRAEEEPGTFSFHTWETVKSQVATPAFVWYFQKNPAGPGIPGHNLLWKNKIIKYQSL